MNSSGLCHQLEQPPLVLSTTPVHRIQCNILAVEVEGAEHYNYGISPAAATSAAAPAAVFAAVFAAVSAAVSAAAAPIAAGTLLNSASMITIIMSLLEIAKLTFVVLLCGLRAFPSGHTVKGCVVMEVLV